MKNKALLAVFLLTSPITIYSQSERIYPLPQMSVETKKSLDARTVWREISSHVRLSLPQAVDNSQSEYFPPIINQQGGSCAQASGIGYVFTYEMNRLLKRNALESRENQYAYMYTWNFINGGKDEGGFVNEGFQILKNYGAMTLDDFGDVSAYAFQWATGYDKYLRAMQSRVKQTYYFDVKTYDDIEHVKSYLYDKQDGLKGGGLLCFSSYSRGWEMQSNYSGPSMTGYTSVLTKLATDGAHALTIVGYDDLIESKNINGEIRKGAFIVANTWGEYAPSHDRGRYYIPYHFFTERKDNEYIESVLTTKLDAIDVIEYDPKVVMRLVFSHSSRNDLSIERGVSQKYTSQVPQSPLRLPIVSNQGGDYPMQGKYADNAEQFELAIDYTPFVSGETDHPKQYILNVLMGGRGSVFGEGHIKKVCLYDYRMDKNNPTVYEADSTAYRMMNLGENYISIIPTSVSASDYRIENKKINTYVVRQANGDFSKIEIDAREFKNDKLKLRFKYNKNCTTTLDK